MRFHFLRFVFPGQKVPTNSTLIFMFDDHHFYKSVFDFIFYESFLNFRKQCEKKKFRTKHNFRIVASMDSFFAFQLFHESILKMHPTKPLRRCCTQTKKKKTESGLAPPKDLAQIHYICRSERTNAFFNKKISRLRRARERRLV